MLLLLFEDLLSVKVFLSRKKIAEWDQTFIFSNERLCKPFSLVLLFPFEAHKNFSEKVCIVQTFKVAEAVAQRCSVKKVLLEISQNSQENICARVSFLIKLQAEKRDSGWGVFMNSAKFLGTPFSQADNNSKLKKETF